MKEKVKISDIARKGGVSVSTVSLVLNNKPGVSQETRQRVLEIAQQYEYPVRTPLSGSQANRLSTIAMLVKTDPDSTPIANPFYSKVMLGIEESCRRNGINLLFATLPVDEDNHPLEVPQLLYNESVDGLLLVGVCLEENSLPNTRHNLPIVLVDGYATPESYDTVVSDNFRAAYQAVEYLIARGHRHIGLAGSSTCCYPSLKERRNGYLRALKEHDISATYIADFNITRSKGQQEILDLLTAQPQLTALFCVNDDVASVANRAVQSLGKRVPEDVSVIGYDDTYLAEHAHPQLTVMHVDTLAMGRAAVNLLALRLANPEAARMTLVIHPQLVERESVAAPPA